MEIRPAICGGQSTKPADTRPFGRHLFRIEIPDFHNHKNTSISFTDIPNVKEPLLPSIHRQNHESPSATIVGKRGLHQIGLATNDKVIIENLLTRQNFKTCLVSYLLLLLRREAVKTKSDIKSTIPL
ncbi:hypothetical protein DLK05_05170 [Ancylomarina longa]|uniref:Uncharacterized protein n=1 Tax=Ancylomarina longa TaxID=2487017 RepID=A0A434AXR3_9BACT|nr:hypothetical protein DLK05_05170 [Ancylomarina longa]